MRTRTPPLLKWLLVERATVAGDLARASEREATVERELENAQERLAQLTREAERLQRCKTQLPHILSEMQVRLAALDTSIRLASEDQVSPTAAGTVRSFSDRYGKRGDLKAFVIKVLQDAVPEALDTRTVVQRAIVHFGLDFTTHSEHQAFVRNTIGPQLFKLKKQGLVQALHLGNCGGKVGIWRWKTAYPTLGELTRQVLGDEPAADALGRQVV